MSHKRRRILKSKPAPPPAPEPQTQTLSSGLMSSMLSGFGFSVGKNVTDVIFGKQQEQPPKETDCEKYLDLMKKYCAYNNNNNDNYHNNYHNNKIDCSQLEQFKCV